MPTQWSLKPNTLITRDDSRFISNMVDGDVILMNVKTGNYVALRTSGRVIWEMLEKPITMAGLMAAILDEYEVDEEEATADTTEFLKQLLDHGMIRILTN
ncbi:hypothetical protein BEL04_13050 [Mucilaginibacter sp. PPCGB 2223]|uniref:PqqD family peptide modification chaperone n=1 Tax=Mucilaginibacter sp. PPCGB 2223 TaxID=1886027 RepID=UPI0008255D28|nr:PqqD family peptide modification chaperone [Mucilaginibacter sp. PPCGB 2223]OCX52390.1 hypothetical protein BEL04_13050 [Mucilaginibacter sp. PPCGB 2223]